MGTLTVMIEEEISLRSQSGSKDMIAEKTYFRSQLGSTDSMVGLPSENDLDTLMGTLNDL